MSIAQGVALLAVVAVIGGAFYMLSQQPAAGQAYQLPAGPASPTDTTAQIISASGGALGSLLGGVGSIISSAESGGNGNGHASTKV